MGRAMTESEVRAFMGTGSRTGKLATVRADGRPHVMPVWFTFDPATGDLVFMTWHTSLKAKNLRRDPRVSISVDDEQFPFAWARLDGTASLTEEDLVHWATETSRRYVGDDRAADYGERNGVAGELVVRVHPTRLIGERNVAS
jgi:PPOX class probable F420-dependent enzyme